MSEIVITEKRKRGRPYVGPLVAVRVPELVIAELDAYAHDRTEKRAASIRRLLVLGLAAERQS